MSGDPFLERPGLRMEGADIATCKHVAATFTLPDGHAEGFAQAAQAKAIFCSFTSPKRSTMLSTDSPPSRR